MPNGRCSKHGGKSLSGLDSGTFKHGRYSKDVPARMMARYEAAEHDPKLLELRSEIALVDARLSEVLGKVDTGEAGALWRDLQAARQVFLGNPGDGAEAVRKRTGALAAMLRLIEAGAADYQAWQDIHATIERRRRLVESEHRRMKDLDVMIEVRQLNTLLGAILSTLKTHVRDADILAAVARDLRPLLSGGVSGQA